MFKKFLTAILLCIFLLVISIHSFADIETSKPDFAIGWQYSRPASGFSLKIPYQDIYYIQPIFSVSMTESDTFTEGSYALGLRGIYNLQKHQDFLPYAGVAVGYSKNFKKTADAKVSNENTAYEAFFGIEYQKYLVRPAVEIGIGGINKYDGSFHAGVVFNLSVLYYF